MWYRDGIESCKETDVEVEGVTSASPSPGIAARKSYLGIRPNLLILPKFVNCALETIYRSG